MHECPHCQHPGITSLQKLCSLFTPAACRLCGRRSFLHLRQGLLAFITWVLLSWLFIGIALYQRQTLYLIGTIPALLLAVDKFMLRAPLHALR